MPKNIVICCDSIFNDASRPSNVLRLYLALETDVGNQIALYHPGVTGHTTPSMFSALRRFYQVTLGLAFGHGHLRFLSDCYSYLMDNYEPGDRVFLFGFGRGAYTARGLASLVYLCGLIRRGNHVLIPEALDLFVHPTQKNFDIATSFRSMFSRPCRPHFVGVWDTASTVGWTWDPVKFPYTSNNPAIAIGRHAVSIDERRSMFRPNLWGSAMPGQDLKQVWFAGVHADIGGGYSEHRSGLSKITLEWMIGEARSAGLLFNEILVAKLLGRDESSIVRSAQPDPLATLHSSLTGFFWPMEFLPRRVYDTNKIPPLRVWRIPSGRRRRIPEGAVIHESVVERMRLLPSYAPPNPPKTYAVERTAASVSNSVEAKIMTARFVNSWVDSESREINKGVWYRFNINIGPRGVTGTEQRLEHSSITAGSSIEVLVSLFSKDFDIQERRGKLSLATAGISDRFCTNVKAKRDGPCAIEIVITSSDSLDILQRATAEIVVGSTAPDILYA